MHLFLKRSLALSSTLTLLCVSGAASASGFALNEESVALMGSDYAGSAASVANASSEYYNPALASLFKHEAVSVGGVLLPVKVTFDGDWYQSGNKSASAKGLTASALNVVPNFHYVKPVSDRLSFAFGLTVPFGLKTKYDTSAWDPVGGSAGVPTLTSISAINMNPNWAYRVTPKLALAAGIDVMAGEAQYNAQIGDDGELELTNDLKGTALGYNLGLLYQFSQNDRVGISYRSRMTLKAKGPSQLVGSEGTLYEASATADLNLPDSATISLFHKVSARWDVLASLVYTDWSVLQNLMIKNTAMGDVNANLHYKDSWFASIGTHYRLSSRWALRAGVGYDTTPTQDGYRDLRLPGQNRFSVAAGVHYQLRKNLGVDLAYQHLFIPTAKVDPSKRPEAADGQYAIGDATMQVNLIGLELSASF